MSRLAIKGHETRGEEVIKLLKMLGGKNKFEDISFITPYIFLFVDDDYYTEIGWDYIGDDNNYEEFVIYTLEEFEEKFPYKVGDTVACYVGIILEKEAHKIIGMQWDSNKCRILYHLDNFNVIEVEDILYSIECKTEQSKQERVKDMDLKNYGTATIKYIQENGSRDMELIIPCNQEIVNIDGRYILRDKKPQYPTTYKECCDVLGIDTMDNDAKGYKHFLVIQFQELLIARDAYWKIAGDWRPEFRFVKKKYCIMTKDNKVISATVEETNRILAFPTEEMRDAFYNNFKDLIEQCKELL